MYTAALVICVAALIIMAFKTPEPKQNGTLDTAGVFFNILLSVLYVPLSLYGIFSVFAADSMFLYSSGVQKVIELMVGIGVSLPFASILSIMTSVALRRKGISVLSFAIQFVPLLLFVIMIVVFELVSRIPV